MTLNSSRKVYGSNIQSRLSTSPHKNKTFSNMKYNRKIKYCPKRYKGLKTSLTKPAIKFRKPLSISPSRIFKLKMNSPDNTEDGSIHYTPYVTKSSSKRQSFLPSPESSKVSLKYTPKPTSMKLYRDSSNKKLSKTAMKHTVTREEEKGELFEPSNTIKNRRKQKQAFIEEKPKTKQKTFSGVKKPKTSKKKIKALENRKREISSQIYCIAPELNPSLKENPFELSDDTAYERSRHSHHRMGKYSRVVTMKRSSKGNKAEKRISVSISNHNKFGTPKFDKIFEDFFIIGIESKKNLSLDEKGFAHPKVLYSYVNYSNKEDLSRVESMIDF